MQVLKRAIKTTVLLGVITVIYSTFLIKTELPLLFCVCYAIHRKNLPEVTAVSFVSGVVTCAFGKYAFLYSMLLCLYTSYIFLIFKPKKRPFLKNFALFLACAIISTGSSFIYNSIVFVPVYFITRKIYKEKEKLIFS